MRKFLIIVSFIIIACMFCGCYSPYETFKQYPWYRAECWYCEEIDMTIRFSVDEDGMLIESPSNRLAIGGIMHDIDIVFQHKSIGFFCDLDGDGKTEEILGGTWACWGEQMVITISEESVWDGQYTELVFQVIEQ